VDARHKAGHDGEKQGRRKPAVHILVLGAAGMVGRKLVERLLKDGRLGKTDIRSMTLQDVVAPAAPAASGIAI